MFLSTPCRQWLCRRTRAKCVRVTSRLTIHFQLLSFSHVFQWLRLRVLAEDVNQFAFAVGRHGILRFVEDVFPQRL